jgi:hypothetical protein
MPLHPQVQTHLDRLAQTSFAELHTLPPEQIREGMRRMAKSPTVDLSGSRLQALEYVDP